MDAYKLFLGFCFAMGFVACSDFQEQRFIDRELSGPLIKLQDIHHGQFYLYIVDNKTKDTVRYALRLSRFLEEHGIQVGDSLSKEAESNRVSFYRKKNGVFQKTTELFY